MSSRRKMMAPKRGEIYLVNFDPTIGSEIKKTRPALIVQNDIANQYSPVTIVAAITSQISDKTYPTEVTVSTNEGGLNVKSTVLLNQIRSIDKQRLIKRMGSVRQETMSRVDKAIAVSMGLIKI